MNIVTLERDTQPKDGAWVDVHDILANPTPHEIELGNRIGAEINTGDDLAGGYMPVQGFASGLSGRDEALERARIVKQRLLAHGVPEVSIELQEGRPTYGGVDPWNACLPVGPLSHHTVSRYSATSLTPVLALCKSGRVDVPGPLCNGYGGWDLCYRILCCGMANHSGEGGPMILAGPKGSYHIPEDSGRAHLWGTEYEGGLAESDWDRVLKNPRTGDQMTFREFMGRCNAALAEAVWLINKRGGLDGNTAKELAVYHGEHLTWAPGRKIDRLGYTTTTGRAELVRWAEGEEDMQLNELKNWDIYPSDDKSLQFDQLMRQLHGFLQKVGPRQQAVLEAIRNQDPITDEELDEIVKDIVAVMPDAQVDPAVVRKAAHSGAMAALNKLRLTTEPEGT